jgi:hypothetical protein
MTKVTAPSLHVGAPPKLRVATLIEALCAVHLSSYVDAPFQERGGLMLVGPPSVLKTTLLEIVSRAYYDAVTVSDINARTLDDLRDQIAAKQIRTLVVPELRKLYERHSQTSSNVEGTIRALVAEGFGAASFNDGRVNQLRARATFMSAMQPKFQVEHFKAWEDSGFNRRFLWALVNMADPHLLDRAVEDWKLIDFPVRHLPPAPVTSLIPNSTTREERAEIRRLVRFQPGGAQSIQMALLVKMLSVLKWWYKMSGRREREAVTAVRDFSAALGKEGAELIL